MSSSLAGRVVVNTRATHQAAELDRLLEARGASSVSFPCIAIEPIALDTIDAALAWLASGHYDWLVLTSGNTVQAIVNRLDELDLTLAAETRVACVGPKTAEAAERLLGATVESVPDAHHAIALAERIPVKRGERVLLPASDIAPPDLARMLEKKGATVDRIAVYRTLPAATPDAGALIERRVDAVTFASPSAVDAFVEVFEQAGIDLSALGQAVIACIGPSTFAAASRYFPDPIVAQTHTLAGLVDALIEHLSPVTVGERM